MENRASLKAKKSSVSRDWTSHPSYRKQHYRPSKHDDIKKVRICFAERCFMFSQESNIWVEQIRT